ncbi:hypothetical protein BHM03_00035494 [Ensete ventricosum]|nr:hypothetical protein BHM03_00035494 [Ensete ventricosum]
MEVDANISHWLYPSLAVSAISCLKRALGALNPHLAMDMFLVGHSVTLADIIMTCNLYLGFSLIMLKSFTSEFPRVEGISGLWLINQTSERQTQFLVPSQKKYQTKEVVKPKEVKKEPKQEAVKPKGGRKKKKREKSTWSRACYYSLIPLRYLSYAGEELLERSVARGRFLLLARGGGTRRRFCDMYDPKGYSLWFCDYKYNEENTVSFMTLNKVSGFLQRMDLAHKYAFGKMLVIGSDPPFKVKVLWLFHGLDILKFVLDEV